MIYRYFVIGGIAAVTGPSAALLTLSQIVVVVESINLISAPGDLPLESFSALSNSEGE